VKSNFSCPGVQNQAAWVSRTKTKIIFNAQMCRTRYPG